jgi:hypothetical protein
LQEYIFGDNPLLFKGEYIRRSPDGKTIGVAFSTQYRSEWGFEAIPYHIPLDLFYEQHVAMFGNAAVDLY